YYDFSLHDALPICKTFGVVYLALAGQVVVAVLVELAGGAVQGQGHVLAQLVAGVGNGFGAGSQGVFVGRQVRREATFVTHGGAPATALEYGLGVMEDFGTHAQGIAAGHGAHRLGHALLDVDVVVGVLATVDDVHHRHRHAVLAGGAVQVGNVRVQRHALGLGSGLGGSQGYGEDGVGAQIGLVLGTVQFDHGAVQAFLIQGITTDQQFADGTIDVGNRLEYALAQVTALVAVTQFQC